ncbi:MAG: archaellar assembly protein FlaJ [Dehalococcoidales bacterium]|nr:archaellar assembly protein FlaJ [Dehalococcoidales bacterium]
MSISKLSSLNDIKSKLSAKGGAAKSSVQSKKKSVFAFKDKSAFSFDMLYQLSCMSVIAAAGVPRKLIFEYAAKLPCSAAESFKKVDTTCEKLKYDYAKGCRLVGENTKEDKMRELLLRFSSSLLSGEPESDFLVREAKSQAEDYENEYGRKIEALKLWTDAYVSLILSAILVIIMGIVSTMIWKVEFNFLIGLVFISTATTGVGVWLIYLMSPREKTVLSRAGSKEQKQAHSLLKIIVPVAAVICSLVVMRGMNFGWALLILGIMVFPIGWIMNKDDAKVTKRDSEIGTFLASLGGICGAIGTTVKEALSRIDMESINCLRVEVKRLYVRLKSGIKPRLCWDKFVEETGSELVHRSIGMFYDSIDVGGDAEQVGYHAGLFANKVASLRAKRKAVATPFRYLCITMHAAVIALLVFVSEVITIFGNMVGEAEAAMPQVSGATTMSAFTSFNVEGLGILHTLVLPLVIIFTVANSLAPSIADGGSWYKTFFNLGVLCIISGGCMVFLPEIAATLFSSVQVN